MRNSTTSCTCNDNAAGLILTSHADGRSSWAFTSFLIGSSANGIGRGGFAQRDFSRGDLIIAEPPLAHFIVPDRKLISGIELADILEKTIESLNDAQRTAYFALAQLPDGGIAGLPNSMEAAHGIWMTNAYPTTSGRDEGGDGQAVFEQICRLNHSCSPRCAVVDCADGLVRVVTTRPIRKGEEVCFCYSSSALFQPRAQRRATLQRMWSFSCECERCTGQIHRDEQRAWRLLVVQRARLCASARWPHGCTARC